VVYQISSQYAKRLSKHAYDGRQTDRQTEGYTDLLSAPQVLNAHPAEGT